MKTTKSINLETLLTNQNIILEMITTSNDLSEILNKIACLIESSSPMWCSFLLLGKDQKTLYHAASPSLPKGYCDAIDGVTIGENVGSCGTAAYLKKPIVVTDIANDPLWVPFADLAKTYNLAACWSTPILSKEADVLGTFAMYYPEPRSPTPWDKELIDKAIHLASIAIMKRNDEDKLKELNINLEDKVNQRTNELSEALERLENTQEKLVHSEKMAALGNLTASIAHEINNPTNFTYAAVYMMLDEIIKIKEFLKTLAGGEHADAEVLASFNSEFSNLVELVNTANQGTIRIKNIVESLRTFSHFGHLKQEQAKMSSLIESTISLIKTEYRNITFINNVEYDPVINCFPSKLNQVFMNLIINACQAINNKSELKKASNEKLAGIVEVNTLQEKDSLVITIIDNGCGMDDTTKLKLFEPFYTTKDSTKGIGLGMSVSLDVIELHKGKIAISSKLNEGSTITINLPSGENLAADALH
jgi:signal transduction histidine kinase